MISEALRFWKIFVQKKTENLKMQRKNGKTEKMKTHKFERGEESKNSKEREGSKRVGKTLYTP